MDVLRAMFNNALAYGILLGVPLETYGKMCHLQYADDLLLFVTEGLEDFRIFKLIIYFFEGISGLSINFHKSCLYSSMYGVLL